MKYTATVVLAVLATVSAAQQVSDIPACALSCIENVRTSETDCAADDYICICSNSEHLTDVATPCVQAACGAEVALDEVLPAVQAFCAAAIENGGNEPTPEPTSELTPTPSSSESTPVPTTLTIPESYPVPTPTTTVTSIHAGGNATSTVVLPTLTSPTTLIPTAGAIGVGRGGSLGGFAVVVLGALVAF